MGKLLEDLEAHTHHSAIDGALKQLVSIRWRRHCLQLVLSCFIFILVALSFKLMPANNPGTWLRLCFWVILIVGIIALGIDQRLSKAARRVIRRNKLILTVIRIYRDDYNRSEWYADFAGNSESGEFSTEFAATWSQVRLLDKTLRYHKGSKVSMLTGPPSNLFG